MVGSTGNMDSIQPSTSVSRMEVPKIETTADGHASFSSILDIGSSYTKASQQDSIDCAHKVRWHCTSEDSERSKARIEDQMNNENLRTLQQIFQEADQDGGGGLDIQEFGQAVKLAFGYQEDLDDRQLAILFMKVDTNCDGTVDWEEFCSYMLLENQQKDNMNRDVLDLPFPNQTKEIPSPHHDTIVKITYLPSLGLTQRKTNDVDRGTGRYVSCSKDGILVFWGQDLHPQRTVMLGELNSSPNKSKQIWVTDLVCLANVKKVAVSTTEREITFYDCSATNFEKQFWLCGLRHCVLAMDYWYDPCNMNESCLVFGDSGGSVSCITFSQATVGLFDVNIGKKSEISSAPYRRILFTELLLENHPHVKAVTFPKIHEDWVRKVKYIHNLHGFISCDSTSNTSLFLGDLNKKKVKSYFKVKKGLYTFDYDKNCNCIITGGMDRHIRLWNPYVTSKATSILKGHVSAITNLIACGEIQQIISVSKDRMVKIWDIRDHCCIQTIPIRLSSVGPYYIASAYYNRKSQILLLGSNVISILERKSGNELAVCDDEPTSHSKPVCAAIYNEVFGQVVSACLGSVVNVWLLDTGEKVMMFSDAHDGAEMTAITFDPTKRRLITGARDGSVKIWNFNNGACLKNLRAADDCEVTGIVCPQQRIVVAGWNHSITVYRDVRNSDEPPTSWNHVHKDDVVAIQLYQSSMLGTASYDGQITAWSLDTGHVYCQFNVNSIKDLPVESRMQLSTDDAQTAHEKLPIIMKVEGREKNQDFKHQYLPSMPRQQRTVDKLHFLQTRKNTSGTATLLVSTEGVIQAWSVYGNHLLGQFIARQLSGDFVIAIASDNTDSLLFTGDTSGYIKIWDITDFCTGQGRENSAILGGQSLRPAAGNIKTRSEMGFLKRRKSKVDGTKSIPTSFFHLKVDEIICRNEPPPLLTSFRGHTKSIVSLDYVKDKELVISASTDCCVRLWTVTGRFIGTFGQKGSWRSLARPENLNKLPQRIPNDLQRVGSSNTLNTISGPPKGWSGRALRNTCYADDAKLIPMIPTLYRSQRRRKAKNIFQLLNFGRAANTVVQKKVQGVSTEQVKDSYYRKSKVLEVSLTDILGKNYKPRKRHNMRPIQVRPRMSYNQCIVYSSLPCSDLLPLPETGMPPIVNQFHTLKQSRPSTVGLDSQHHKGPKTGKGEKFAKQTTKTTTVAVNRKGSVYAFP